jgi:hypothetical protein
MDTDRFVPDLDAWNPWTPREITRRCAGSDVPWCVVGGWALDLYLGRETRHHDDLEIAVPRDRIGEILPAVSDCELFAVSDGYAWPYRAGVEDGSHQIWVRERSTQQWRIDFFREPHDGDLWICRRNPAIRLPYERLVRRTPDGIPFAVPEVILLFKAKATREKDEADIAVALPQLEQAALEWLRSALRTTHPDHSWVDRVNRELASRS